MPTEIQWTDETWNPLTGCSRVSPGCANCYIERTPPFRMAGRRFETVGQASTTGVQLHPDRLEQPLHWRKPRRVFVCSLADLFHDDVSEGYIAHVFSVMARAPQHTFQVLTKRPERARELLNSPRFWYAVRAAAVVGVFPRVGVPHARVETPLPNVWLGVSVENARFTWRADVLREIPAAVRFISAEPLLGSLFESQRELELIDDDAWSAWGHKNLTLEEADRRDRALALDRKSRRQPLDLTGIDWVIVGGESGPGARPFHLEHAREIIGHCLPDPAAPLPLAMRPAVFVKQLGAKPHSIFRRPSDLRDAVSLPLDLRDAKGGDWDEWPPDLRIREFPRTAVAA